jgi:hypothetical protein
MPRLNLGVCTGEKLEIQGKDTDRGKENALPATPSTPSEGSDPNENLGSKATTTGGSVIELTVSRVPTLSKLSVESVREIQLGVASEVSGGDEDAWTYIALKQSRSEEVSRQNTSTHLRLILISIIYNDNILFIIIIIFITDIYYFLLSFLLLFHNYFFF